jgi:hypothetical protein
VTKNWFVAAIPENEPVNTVIGTKIALKPKEVRTREQALGRKESFRRRNAAYVRQGEWFFLSEPHVGADSLHILRNEPLSRGNGSKAHIVKQCCRSGGETVYASGKYPLGISAEEYKRLPERERTLGFTMMKRDAAVYVRGEVRHPDHGTMTLTLNGWHRCTYEHRESLECTSLSGVSRLTAASVFLRERPGVQAFAEGRSTTNDKNACGEARVCRTHS